jgi:hypothetical protein
VRRQTVEHPFGTIKAWGMGASEIGKALKIGRASVTGR